MTKKMIQKLLDDAGSSVEYCHYVVLMVYKPINAKKKMIPHALAYFRDSYRAIEYVRMLRLKNAVSENHHYTDTNKHTSDYLVIKFLGLELEYEDKF